MFTHFAIFFVSANAKFIDGMLMDVAVGGNARYTG